MTVGRESGTGPKEAARHQVQVALITHGRVVVTKSRAEDPSFAVLVGPGHDVVRGLFRAVVLFDQLSAPRQRMRCWKDLEVVVKLFLDRGPIAQTARNRMFPVQEVDRDGFLRAVGVGLDTGELEPILRAGAIAM